jgi:5-methylcytosine-specific restriction endonuclease McrA
MSVRILRINTAGSPIEWLSWQDAVCLHARELVSWTYGEEVMDVHGGFSRCTGEQTVVTLNSIMACKGKVFDNGRRQPPLTNRALFKRDSYTCLYCGNKFKYEDLSRDHVKPVSKGGKDVWTNVVTSCKRCNARKGNSNLADISMDLLALPYQPNHAEFLALSHSGRILGDQMAFLKRQFSSNSRLLMDGPIDVLQ